jgi:hypothetical protein
MFDPDAEDRVYRVPAHGAPDSNDGARPQFHESGRIALVFEIPAASACVGQVHQEDDLDYANLAYLVATAA